MLSAVSPASPSAPPPLQHPFNLAQVRSIGNIVRSSAADLFARVTAQLNARAQKFVDIQDSAKRTGTTAGLGGPDAALQVSGISSVLRGTGANQEMKPEEHGPADLKLYRAIDALEAALADGPVQQGLAGLMGEPLGYRWRNFTSILNGARVEAGAGFRALASGETRAAFQQLEALGFKPDNVAGCLNGSGPNIVAAITNLVAALKEEAVTEGLGRLKELGYSITNFTSMLNGAGVHAGAGFRALASGETYAAFQQLEALGFKPDNVASCLNGSGPNIVAAISNLVAALKEEAVTKGLSRLREELGYSITNFTSMLSGARFEAGAGFRALASKETYAAFEALRNLGFKPGNVASCLDTSGPNIVAAITNLVAALKEKAVTEGLGRLKELGYSITNFTSMLSGAGVEAGAGFRALASGETYAAFQQLEALGFKPGNVAGCLSGSGPNIVAAIKDVVAALKEEAVTKGLDRLQKELGYSITNFTSMLHGARFEAGAGFRALTSGQTRAAFQQLEALGFTPDNVAGCLSGSRRHIAEDSAILAHYGSVLQELDQANQPFVDFLNKAPKLPAKFETAIRELAKQRGIADEKLPPRYAPAPPRPEIAATTAQLNGTTAPTPTARSVD